METTLSPYEEPHHRSQLMKSTYTAGKPDGRTRVDQAAVRLYDAECALHIARQTRVDLWINAAADHLHLAVLELRAVE